MSDMLFLKNQKKKYAADMGAKLASNSWHVWVAEIQGEVVGFTLGKREATQLYLKKGIFVMPEYQGHGIGSALFEASLEPARSGDTVRLSVIENNHRAKRLYQKHGFMFAGYSEKTFFGARLEVMELTVREHRGN